MRLEDRVADLESDLHGGPQMPFERAVRGRLHGLTASVAALEHRDELAAALATALEARSDRRFSRRETIVGLLLAAAVLLVELAGLVATLLHVSRHQ